MTAALCPNGDGRPVRANGLCATCNRSKMRRAAGAKPAKNAGLKVFLPPVRVTPDLLQRLTARAAYEGIDRAELARQLLDGGLVVRELGYAMTAATSKPAAPEPKCGRCGAPVSQDEC